MTLNELAQKACEKHANPKQARRFMRDVIVKSPQLLDSIIDDLIRAASTLLVGRQRNAIRRELQRGIVQPPARPMSAMSAAKNIAAKQLLSFLDRWPVGRTVLGDMDREGLLSEAQKERNAADGHTRVATFYESLASKLAGKKRVRDCITPEQAGELWETAQAA